MEIEEKKFLTISNADYHANKEWLGHSALLRLLRSPAHYQAYLNEPERDPTPALLFGQAFHTAVLEPERFASDYAVFDESLLHGTLQSMDDYKYAASILGVRVNAMAKDDLKAAIKAADEKQVHRFRDDVNAELDVMMKERQEGSLHSLEEYKAAATSLGIEVVKMKKDELKAAIRVADTTSQFVFREDIIAAMATIEQEMLQGTLQSLEDYQNVAKALGISYQTPTKDELKVAIKAADAKPQFVFREDRIASLYDGKTVLKQDELDILSGILTQIAAHAGASKLLRFGTSEQSLFWTDPETGVKCKIRIDRVVEDETGRIIAILDAKAARDASKEGFRKAVEQYGYDVQAAYYSDGFKETFGYEVPFLFLAAENEFPCAIALYKASAEMIETGRKKARAGLLIKQWCEENQSWPGYQTGDEEDIEEITPSSWAMKSAAEFDI